MGCDVRDSMQVGMVVSNFVLWEYHCEMDGNSAAFEIWIVSK